jgi:hypothetical protein
MTRRLPLLLGALAFATAFQTGTESAEARGSVHFSGHVSGHWSGAHVSGSVHWSRPAWRGGYSYYGRGWRTGGHIWVGGGYYWPRYYWYRPYAYYGYYPEYVPSYYYPVQPGPAAPAVTAAVVAPRPELPKLGIGLFAGGVSVQDVQQSQDVGIMGRLRLGNGGLLVEGELGKTSYENDTRVDRRLGGSLVYEFGAQNRFAPYVLAGLGVNQASVNGDYNTTQDFAELGVGLRLAVTPHLHVLLDVRAGSRNTVSNDNNTLSGGTTTARTIAPPTSDSGQNEDYTRVRLAGMLYF